MKKTLVALAALASVSAFAQVTITGLLDASYSSTRGSGTDVSTKADTVNAAVGSATSNISITSIEDLGGGMKATVFYGIDPRTMFANSTSSTLGRHEMYLGLSGDFGSIKLGSPNTAALSAMVAGQVFGTATGSGFANLNTAAGSGVRFNNSVRYDTPAISGFSASVNYAPGNNDATAQTATLAAAPQVTDVGLAYTNGPLNVNYSNLKRSAVVAATAAAQADGTPSFGLAAVTAAAASTYTSVGANYKMGNFKVLAGYGSGKLSGTNAVDSKYTSLGGTYTMGATTLLVGVTSSKLGTADARKATGMRLDYALSKRTVAYVVNESYDSGATSANKTNIFGVGARHSF